MPDAQALLAYARRMLRRWEPYAMGCLGMFVMGDALVSRGMTITHAVRTRPFSFISAFCFGALLVIVLDISHGGIKAHRK